MNSGRDWWCKDNSLVRKGVRQHRADTKFLTPKLWNKVCSTYLVSIVVLWKFLWRALAAPVLQSFAAAAAGPSRHRWHSQKAIDNSSFTHTHQRKTATEGITSSLDDVWQTAVNPRHLANFDLTRTLTRRCEMSKSHDKWVNGLIIFGLPDYGTLGSSVNKKGTRCLSSRR